MRRCVCVCVCMCVYACVRALARDHTSRAHELCLVQRNDHNDKSIYRSQPTLLHASQQS
jgi:hypothetical protein